MSKFKFHITHKSSKSNARTGFIETAHGIINTPAFVAVGTNGTLKALDNVMLEQLLKQDLIFCNTYHLLVHPGPDVIENAGGLHKFINRSSPIITDSGGFQIFSLAYGGVANELKSKGSKTSNDILKISEDGVIFRSYRNGDRILLTPEISVDVQKKLGSDIIIPLDELLPYHSSQEYLVKSLERTHRWEKRSLDAHLINKKNQAMYAVVHGGLNKELRKLSANYLSKLDFEGFAIGGSLGKNTSDVVKVLGYTVDYLDPIKPMHLLGIGDIATIKAAIPYGIDSFDSAYPTKIARHGLLLRSSGQNIKIMQTIWRKDFEPIDPKCFCYVCQNYSKAYLHHLFKCYEPSALTLGTIHNISIMNQYMENLRSQILNNEI
ncbi:MAG: tRNA guanosine(34) transglycosylase Tgt [Rickettsiaceae bacterium]